MSTYTCLACRHFARPKTHLSINQFSPHTDLHKHAKRRIYIPYGNTHTHVYDVQPANIYSPSSFEAKLYLAFAISFSARTHRMWEDINFGRINWLIDCRDVTVPTHVISEREREKWQSIFFRLTGSPHAMHSKYKSRIHSAVFDWRRKRELRKRARLNLSLNNSCINIQEDILRAWLPIYSYIQSWVWAMWYLQWKNLFNFLRIFRMWFWQ